MLDAGVLPVAEIAVLARRESVRPRAAYQSHKWFARRLAATARSLLVAATTPADKAFWPSYYEGADCSKIRVLDPFMGGGVMLLEASRLGADVYGADVEPVAAAISDFQGRLSKILDLSAEMSRLSATVGAELAPYYRAVDQEGRDETLLHGFWVQSVECQACSNVFDAHPSFRLAWDEAAKRQWIVCRGCGDIHESSTSRKTLRCNCGVTTDSRLGVSAGGKASCPHCGHEHRLIELAARTGAPPTFRLFAIETIPAGPERAWPMKQRRIRAATLADQDILHAAEARLADEAAADPGFLVDGAIPAADRFDDRLVKYGYRSYRQLFNARQSLHLGLLARALDDIDGLAGEALRIAFSDHAMTNNMLCAYAGGWRRLSPLFSIRAFRHIARPVEINPWLTKNGRGTFPNAVRAVANAGRAVRASIEPQAEGDLIEVPTRRTGSWDVRCIDAQDLSHIPSGSIDLVLTDPPYFDYIAYSELGHFFAPWMVRLGLLSRAALSGFPSGQLASALGGQGAEARFAAALTRRLIEVSRTCAPHARMVFTYQSLNGRGWRALAEAMGAAGIVPINGWPMFGDGGSNLHKRANSISWDCVLHCAVHQSPRTPIFDELSMSAGAAFAERWKGELDVRGQTLSHGDLENLRHAGAVISALNQQFSGTTACLFEPLSCDRQGEYVS